ncbi:hypothetical protein ASD85_06525 [Rhizobium sp. Root651]|nr:hypothetical protein ASD85_06525 [Rhizobium sp. Root651]
MGRQDYETETMVAFPITAGMAASAARMPHEQGALVPVAFAQNTRDEVRLFGGDGQVVGALAAEPGMKQQSYVAEPVAFRDVAQALTSNYGKQADNSDTALGPNIVAQHAVAFDMRGREGGAQFEGPHDTANIRAASGGSSKSYVAQEWAVRRLTPTECERLQGFPEIRKNVKINIWLEDKSQQFAGAETQCITSPSSVSIAGESVSSRSAKSAKQSSIKNRQGLDLPVVLHVLLNLERGAVEIHKAGRCLWSASIAEKQSLSPLHMPIDAFARLIAQITESAEKEAPVGREGSLANTPHSTHPVSGRSFVNVSGHEIERHAEGAAPSTDTLSRHTTSTTSDCGQSSPNSALTMTTLCCSVVAAIGSFIPEIMSQGNSFSVTVEAVRGFTNVPWGKKDTSPDGPRYRALGNSMAVNCMRWIGRRIEMVEKITKGEAA